MPSAVQFSCLAPWSRWLLVCILPSQGTAPNGGLSSRRPRPLRCILAPTVPFAWGSFAPFLSGWHLAVFRPLRYPPHSILGHDSIIRLCVLAESFLSYSIRQEKSTVRPMQNGCVLQDCKKPPQRRGVPLFCRKKRCIIKASGTGRENRGMLPGKACPHPSKKQRKSTVMEILHEINPALEALASDSLR